MRSRGKLGSILGCTLLFAIALAGCGTPTPSDTTYGSTPGATSSSSASSAATATATPPPPRALAWFQTDSHNVGQIWASVNGETAHQITHMPPSTEECRYDEDWSPPVFSPDLSKIVAAWGSDDCTDGPLHGPIYIINASSGAATKVPSADANIRLSLRQTGWIDDSTIWWMSGWHIYKYTIGGSATLLANLSTFSHDAVLRGNTLFLSQGWGSGGFALKRFDMTSHTILAGSIDLGTTNPCACSRNDALAPGFDVSADGSHIVYQKVAPAGAGGDEEGVGSSQFFYANADGSGATRIASVATAHAMVKMQLSPNGRLIAVTRALPAPSIFTASVTSAGHSGDPDMHFYTSGDSLSYPVWKYDNVTFWATTAASPVVTMERFTVGTSSGSVGVSGGNNPWYTIGG